MQNKVGSYYYLKTKRKENLENNLNEVSQTWGHGLTSSGFGSYELSIR
jgi:hypothetical protein